MRFGCVFADVQRGRHGKYSLRSPGQLGATRQRVPGQRSGAGRAGDFAEERIRSAVGQFAGANWADRRDKVRRRRERGVPIHLRWRAGDKPGAAYFKWNGKRDLYYQFGWYGDDRAASAEWSTGGDVCFRRDRWRSTAPADANE